MQGYIPKKFMVLATLSVMGTASIKACEDHDINNSLHRINQRVQEKLEDTNQLYCPLGVSQTLVALHSIADKPVQREIEVFVDDKDPTKTFTLLNQQLQKHTANASDALASLASGKRSIKASQDPASQAITSLISSTVSVLNQAKIGANNAIGLIQVATGGLDNIIDNITQMSSLAAQAQDGSLNQTSLAIINSQFNQLRAQIDDIASRARWNGSSLLNGGMPTLTVAANATQAAIN